MAIEAQDRGRQVSDRDAFFAQLLTHFGERRQRRVTQELQNQLHAASDHAAALELLRQLQNRNVELGPDASSVAGVRS
jgi:hypothetical protein